MKTFYVGVKGIVTDKNKGVLLLRRYNKTGFFWDTPGGRMDGDEEFTDTLKRELSEELPGIEIVQVGELLGAHRVQKDIDAGISLVLLYFEVSASLPNPVQLSEEHDDFLWARTKSDLPEGLNPEITRILHKIVK